MLKQTLDLCERVKGVIQIHQHHVSQFHQREGQLKGAYVMPVRCLQDALVGPDRVPAGQQLVHRIALAQIMPPGARTEVRMAARGRGAELFLGGEHGAAGAQALPVHALQCVDGTLPRGVAGREIQHLAGQPFSQSLQRGIQNRHALARPCGQAGEQPLFAPDGSIHLYGQLMLALSVGFIGKSEGPKARIPLTAVGAFAQGTGRPWLQQTLKNGRQSVLVQRFLMARERLACLVHIAHAQPYPFAGLFLGKHRAVAHRLSPVLRQRLRVCLRAELNLLNKGHIAILKQVHAAIDGHFRPQAGKGVTDALFPLAPCAFLPRTVRPSAGEHALGVLRRRNIGRKIGKGHQLAHGDPKRFSHGGGPPFCQSLRSRAMMSRRTSCNRLLMAAAT